MHPTVPVTTATQVAELLAAVASANGRIAAEADRIACSRAAVSLATIDRLVRLADDLRPGAEARAQLARIDPELLLAGTSVWLARHRLPLRSRTFTAAPAAARAATRWGAATS